MNEENEEQTNIEEEEPNSNQKYFAIILIILCFRAKRVIDPSKTTVDYLTNNITCRLYFQVSQPIRHRKIKSANSLPKMKLVNNYSFKYNCIEVRQIRMMREKETNKFRGILTIMKIFVIKQEWLLWISPMDQRGKH